MGVHVVGGGPAGSIAAISAIRNGQDVIVSEEHPVSGIPENCSGLFSKDGLESLLPFVDYRKCVINPIRGADIHLIDQELNIRRDGPVGYVCDRSMLDRMLAENAEAEGARFYYGERIKDSFRSEHIIGADGPLSTVAERFAFPRIKKHAATLQTPVPYKCEDPHAVQVFLSNRMFPGFFGWIIPQNEEVAEFGVGVQLPHRAQDAWDAFIRLKGVDAPRPRGWLIPIKVRRKTAARIGKHNVLLAGDAAGQVKSTTGGGVVFGGNCAALAGRFADDPLRYELEWRMRFGPDLAMHGLIHRYLSKQSDEKIMTLGRRLKRFNCDHYLSNYGHMDRPTKMLHPEIVIHFLKNISGVS